METIGCLLVLLAYTASIQENYQFGTLPPSNVLSKPSPTKSSSKSPFKEFAKLLGARAHFGYFITPLVTKNLKDAVGQRLTRPRLRNARCEWSLLVHDQTTRQDV